MLTLFGEVMRMVAAFTLIEAVLYSLCLVCALGLARVGGRAVRQLSLSGYRALAVQGYHRSALFYLYRDLSVGRLVSADRCSLSIERVVYNFEWRSHITTIRYTWGDDGMRRAVDRDNKRGRRIYLAPAPCSLMVKRSAAGFYDISYAVSANDTWRLRVRPLL